MVSKVKLYLTILGLLMISCDRQDHLKEDVDEKSGFYLKQQLRSALEDSIAKSGRLPNSLQDAHIHDPFVVHFVHDGKAYAIKFKILKIRKAEKLDDGQLYYVKVENWDPEFPLAVDDSKVHNLPQNHTKSR